MTDVFSKEKRSEIMSKIRSKNTQPEVLLRKELWKKGYRYRIHFKLPGKPDIVFIRKRIVIFIDGCFWHRCPRCYKAPKSNTSYWEAKISKNIERDKLINATLTKKGWHVIRIWEHQIKETLEDVVNFMIDEINKY